MVALFKREEHMNPVAEASIHGSRTPLVARDLLLILLLALLVRLVTFNGAFGSDDITYFGRAAELARGAWTSSNYNGSLRYGFNLPAAGFIALFGESLFAANLWPLTCSLVEIGAVFMFAGAVMNRRAGVFAALLLATAPLHIAVATRIHADPVVSMFVTVGFVLLYFGALQRRPLLLFSAGIAVGGIFWAKELAAVTWFAFLPMLWFFRGHWRNCLYVIAGTVLMMFLHGVLMLIIAGDPLHLVKVILAALKRNFISGPPSEHGAAIFYLRYLFVDLRHTGVLAFFAVASIVVFLHSMRQDTHLRLGFAFALMWWIGLLAVLSVFPISLSPLRFPNKQSNYITLFLAPTALLAGMAIAALPRMIGRLALAPCLALGILLGAMQQADYRAFTANSKALAALAVQHPRAAIVGSTNNSSLGNLWVGQMYPGSQRDDIISFRDLNEREDGYPQRLLEADAIYAVLDRQTMNWYPGKAPVTSALPCWQFELTLTPVGLGVGNELAALASAALWQVKPLADALDRLARPQRADVYRVDGRDALCRG
ncbi:MAG: glycosyltransferase family 39 protein [Sideroxyarcus sp.]|nr:glycosyltransferase family 39 protein [Sideroxyarcus sp.]